MRALVTGSAGFVGTKLVELLTASGDDVVATDRSSGGPDMSDRDAVMDLLADDPCDVVFHLAGQSHVPTSWEDPIGTIRANVEGTQNVIDAAHEAGSRRVLVVTSAEVYGLVDPAKQPIAETQPLRPRNPYAASKVGAEAIAQQAHLGRGQDVIRLRAFNHIGPGQRIDFAAAGLANRIAAAVRSGQRSIAVGNLEPRRDFTDVRDVVAAYRATAERGRAGEVYNVCSGRDRSIREIAEGLLGVAGADLDLVADPALQRDTEVQIMRGDNTKLVTDTGWRPSIDLQSSLEAIYTDAVERLEETSNG